MTAVAGFAKLFSTIVHSTVWREDMHVKIVWITMLALADRRGRVYASLPGLADAARVNIDQCCDALSRLSAPDPFSRTKDHEGRRIEEIDGGWRLLNYLKYRKEKDNEKRRVQVLEAVRRHRAKQPPKSKVSKVSQGKPAVIKEIPSKPSVSTCNPEGIVNTVSIEQCNQDVSISNPGKAHAEAYIADACLNTSKSHSRADARAQHPAIKLVREILSRYPEKGLWDEIIQVLGENPDSERAKATYREWARRGYKPINLAWLFDWYVKGVPEQGQYGGRKDSGRILGLAKANPDDYPD